MKVLHLVSWFFPDSVGGCEVYVFNLVQSLAALGIESIIAVPAAGSSEISINSFRGISIIRYPVPHKPTLEEEMQATPPRAFEQFTRWVRSQNFSLAHQHSWRFGCGR